MLIRRVEMEGSGFKRLIQGKELAIGCQAGDLGRDRDVDKSSAFQDSVCGNTTEIASRAAAGREQLEGVSLRHYRLRRSHH